MIDECFNEIVNGTTTTQNDSNGITVTRIETIQNSRFDLSRVKFIKDPESSLVEKFKYQIGDIAFSHINSMEHVGKVALYEGHPKTLIHGMNLLRLRLGHSFIVPKYAYYYFLTTKFREDVRERVGQAVNQVSINQKNLKEVPFIICPLPEQQLIVAKLDELMEKIDRSRARLERIPKILKRFRQSILSAAVNGKLTEEWRGKNPNFSGKVLLKKSYEDRLIVYEHELSLAKQNNSRKPSKPIDLITIDFEFDEFPESWTMTIPDLVASPDRYSLAIGPFGSNLKVNDYMTSGVPLVFVRHIKNNDFIGQNPKFVSRQKALELTPHSISSLDLLITKMGEPPGDCEIYPEGFPHAIITADCLKFRVWDKYFNRIYFKHLINSYFIKEQLGLITQGVAQQKISLERFKTLQLPIPPLEEQNEIVRRVEQLFALADKIEARYIKAKAQVDKLPQSLLAKAFRGELVPQDEKDEPASVLLERIVKERSDGNRPDKDHKTKENKGGKEKLVVI